MIDGLPWDLERLEVRAVAAGHTASSRQLRVDPLTSELTCDFVLSAAGVLHGSVVDPDGEPVASAGVRVEPGEAYVRTDAGGRFRIPDLPVDKQLQVTVFAGMYAKYFTHLTTTAQSPLRLVVERPPKPHARMVATLADASGRPIEPIRALLLFEPESSTGLRLAPDLEVGRVTANRLRDGRWQLLVWPVAGHQIERFFEVVPESDLVELELTVGPAGRLEGEVVFADSVSAPPERLSLSFGPDGRTGRWEEVPGQPFEVRFGTLLRVDLTKGRRFRVTDVAPAQPLTIQVRSPGWSGRTTVEVGAGQVRSVRLLVEASGRLGFLPDRPWPCDEIHVETRPPGGFWDGFARFDKLLDTRKRVIVDAMPGEVEWRVPMLHSQGVQGAGSRLLVGRARTGSGAETDVILRIGEAVLGPR